VGGGGGGGGGKGGLAYGCLPYHLHVPTLLKLGSLSLGTLRTCPGVCKDRFNFDVSMGFKIFSNTRALFSPNCINPLVSEMQNVSV